MGMADYSISLGALISPEGLQRVKSQIETLETNPIKLKIDSSLVDTKIKGIKQELSGLGKTSGLKLDTAALEASLDRVSADIKEIRAAFGTIDNKSGMNSLLTSINQISTALDRASKQFVELNSQLNSLAGKNFGVNIGLNVGGGNAVSRNAAYGSMARGEIIPQLQQQVAALETYLARYYKVADGINGVNKLIQGTGVVTAANHPMTLLPQMADGSNLSKQMGAYKQYIALIKEAAALKGVDLTPVTSGFGQSADQLVTKAHNVQSGVTQLDDSLQKLKGVFGSGIDSERLSAQLDSIVIDLGEIKTAIQGLSSGTSIEGLIQSFNRLSNTIELFVQNCNNAKTALNTSVGGGNTAATTGVNKTANELTTAYNKLKNISKNISSIKINLSSGLDTSKDVQTIRVLEQQLQTFTTQYHNTVAKIKGKGDLSSTQWQTIQHQIDNTRIKLEQLSAKVTDAKAKLASGIQGNFGNYDAQLQMLEGRFGKLSTKTPELRAGIEAVRQALTSLKTADGTDALIAANERYKIVLNQVEAQLRQNEIIERNSNNTVALTQAKQNLALKMGNWLRDNSAAAKKFGAEIQRLQVQLKNCGNITGVQQVGKAFQNITLQAKEAGVTALTFGDRLKKQFSQYSAYFSVYSLFMYGTMAMRSMFEQVKSIDSAMTELKKVTDETEASYSKFLTNAASRSKEIGTTIDGLVSSTADFARLGYDFKDAQELAEVANIYAVVGDEIDGVEQATESLISTMAAFKDSAGDMSNSDFAMSIIDKFNEIGNNFAISSGGIGEALERSASSLDAANNTIDESIALITAANTVVQDPATVGEWLADIKSGYIG